MATTKFYLDLRGVEKGKAASLKIAIHHGGRTALISTDVRILPQQWDKVEGEIVRHPNRAMLNVFLNNRKQAVENVMYRLAMEGVLNGMTAAEIKTRVLAEMTDGDADGGADNGFAARFVRFADMKRGRTREIYMATYGRMKAFCGEELERLKFESVTKDWLVRFDNFLALTSPARNARNIHFRNIRAVFNDAIDDEVTTAYPFRKFKIRNVATAKRSLTVEQLRELFALQPEEHAVKYLDMFKLMFYLVGINIVDLCNLKGIVGGRVEYYRAKTNRLYSIKVEPEAMEIIERYRGERLLLDILDRYVDYKDYAKRMNDNLQLLGKVEVGKHGKKTYEPMFPQITSYWARHTWATIAASLDIPKETIAAALGHGGNTVTDIYIDFDKRKIDDANRRVIDWVTKGKR